MSMPKLTPKIILEGTRLTFKTDIAFALNEHPRIVGPRKYKYHSPLISAEWCTFTNFPWGKDYDFRWLEERLAPLGFHIILLTRTPESFEIARTERLKVSGNPAQYDNLELFIEEQELMRRLVRESMLPVLELDMSNNTIETAVEHIADWMESTGGLYMNDHNEN